MQREHYENQMRQFQLFSFIEQGNFKAFVGLLSLFNDLQCYQLLYSCDRFGYSLIHQCAFFGQLDILKFLVTRFRASATRLLIQQEAQKAGGN